MKIILIILTAVLAITTPLMAQQPPTTNEFKIGMMGVGAQIV